MKCRVCHKDLDEGMRCQLDRFAHPVDHEGRHDGGCWGGRFPTKKQLVEWQDRLFELKQRRVDGLAVEPQERTDPAHQLTLDFPG